MNEVRCLCPILYIFW